MRRRGRRVALWTGVVVTLLLGASAFAFRATFLEYWYIAGLYSEDEERRLECADKLAAMKSLRAVPHLVDRIREDKRERWVLRQPLRLSGRLLGGLRLGKDSPASACLTPLFYALYRIGPQALAEVRQLPAGEDLPRLLAIPEVLEYAWSLPEKDVHRMSYAVGEDLFFIGDRF